jgi:hypothetical protein
MEENLNIAAQSFVQSPTKSTRKASSQHDILRTRNRRENRNILRFKCISVKRLMAHPILTVKSERHTAGKCGSDCEQIQFKLHSLNIQS